MDRLNVNEWMMWDLANCEDYVVVYAESADEWWIMTSRETYFDAMVALAEYAEEGGEGEYIIIDHNGQKIF